MGTQTIRIPDEAVAILDTYNTKALEARESRNPRTKAKKASYTNLVYAMEKEVRDLRAGLELKPDPVRLVVQTEGVVLTKEAKEWFRGLIETTIKATLEAQKV
jgi:hypothetical protein